MKRSITSATAPAPIGPYSHAIQKGNMLFVSGQVGKHPGTGEIAPDIEGQTRQVMANIKGILHEAEMDFVDVVKATIFLKDLNDFAKVNEIYGLFYHVDFPARETVEVSRLPLDVLVEISVIAIK